MIIEFSIRKDARNSISTSEVNMDKQNSDSMVGKARDAFQVVVEIAENMLGSIFSAILGYAALLPVILVLSLLLFIDIPSGDGEIGWLTYVLIPAFPLLLVGALMLSARLAGNIGLPEREPDEDYIRHLMDPGW